MYSKEEEPYKSKEIKMPLEGYREVAQLSAGKSFGELSLI
jgi:CRP-like cAMP-binding protein